jgi:hypothetical protein
MPQGSDIPLGDPLPNGDGELSGFVERFRSIISQITQETEAGLTFALHDSETGSVPSSASSTTGFPYSSSPFETTYDPYAGYRSPPEAQHVRVLGGYIRRMPTIESLGSREMGSVAHSSVHRDEGARASPTSPAPSRPQTRLSTLSTVSTRTNSIRTSISHHGDIVRWSLAASEAGEVVRTRADNDSATSGHSLSFHTAGSAPVSPLQASFPVRNPVS